MQVSELIAKIERDFVHDATEPITATTELLMSGMVDSLGIINLVTWLEEKLELEIDPGEVVIENFETPAAIVDFTTTLTAGAST